MSAERQPGADQPPTGADGPTGGDRPAGADQPPAGADQPPRRDRPAPRADRPPLHPQARALLEQAQALGETPVYELGPVEARAQAIAAAAVNGAGPPVAEVRELAIAVRGAELRGRRYRPRDARGTIVWYHGGGWLLDGLEGVDAMCRLLANESGASVVSVDYRVAPEHRFPVALDDCFDTLLWVAEQANSAPLVIGGDSAGGNLAAVCALRARDARGPEIVSQVLVYPVTDSDLSTPSYVEYGNAALPMLSTREMAWFFDCYARDRSDLANPELAPLRAPHLSGVAPAIVVVAEYDALRDDALRYAERLRDAGVAVTTLLYDDMPHGFFTRGNLIEVGNQAVALVGAQLRELIAARE